MTAQESARIAGIFESCVSCEEAVCLRGERLSAQGRAQVFVEKSAVPFFDAAGSVCGFRGIDRDISERKHAEDKLQKSYAEVGGYAGWRDPGHGSDC